MSIRIGITDGNREFFHRFRNVLLDEYPKEFEVYLFPSLEKALVAAEKFHIEMILLEAGTGPVRPEELPSATSFFQLVDSMADEDRQAPVPKLCRFRTSSEWREILLEAVPKTGVPDGNESPKPKKHMKRCVFLSAAGGTGTSTAAIAFCTNCARRHRRVLYVSFENVSGILTHYHGENLYTLEDVLLAIRGRRYEFDAVLEQSVCRDTTGVCYLLPARRPQDLFDMTGEEIVTFLDLLSELERFSLVVTDLPFDASLRAVLPAMNADKVVLVSDGSPVANLKTEQVFSNLPFLCQEDPRDVGEKTCLLYNRYRPESSIIQTEAVTKLGGISEQNCSTVTDLVTELSYQPAMERLYRELWEE